MNFLLAVYVTTHTYAAAGGAGAGAGAGSDPFRSLGDVSRSYVAAAGGAGAGAGAGAGSDSFSARVAASIHAITEGVPSAREGVVVIDTRAAAGGAGAGPGAGIEVPIAEHGASEASRLVVAGAGAEKAPPSEFWNLPYDSRSSLINYKKFLDATLGDRHKAGNKIINWALPTGDAGAGPGAGIKASTPEHGASEASRLVVAAGGAGTGIRSSTNFNNLPLSLIVYQISSYLTMKELQTFSHVSREIYVSRITNELFLAGLTVVDTTRTQWIHLKGTNLSEVAGLLEEAKKPSGLYFEDDNLLKDLKDKYPEECEKVYYLYSGGVIPRGELFKFVKGFPNLQQIAVHSLRLYCEGALESLAALRHLTHLWVRDYTVFTTKSLVVFPKLTHLSVLFTLSGVINKDQMRNFLVLFPHLTHLELGGGTIEEEDVLMYLPESLPKLTHLNLRDKRMRKRNGGIDVSYLKNLPLVYLNLDNCGQVWGIKELRPELSISYKGTLTEEFRLFDSGNASDFDD